MVKRTTHSKELFRENTLPESYNPPIVVGCNIKTPENMGNIIRLCDNIPCKEVFFVTEKDIRTSKIKRTASSGFNSVNWSTCSVNELKHKIPSDYKWIAIETTSDSKNIFKTNLPGKVVFFVGNEVNGIENSILDQCHTIVHIPLYGKNTSLNVSHALAIVLFEWQKRIAGL